MHALRILYHDNTVYFRSLMALSSFKVPTTGLKVQRAGQSGGISLQSRSCDCQEYIVELLTELIRVMWCNYLHYNKLQGVRGTGGFRYLPEKYPYKKGSNSFPFFVFQLT
jgi:hypothetical protein